MLLIYVSHPYGGRKEEKKDIDIVIKNIVKKYPNAAYISPLHAIRRNYGKTRDYILGLNCAVEIMKRCDIVFMSGEWKSSMGCKVEYDIAKKSHMLIATNEAELIAEIISCRYALPIE